MVKMNSLKDSHLEKFSGIIISGRPSFVTQENIPELLDLFGFIKTTKTPILGICFGHQIIWLLYGAIIKVWELAEKMETIDFLAESVLFAGIENTSLFRESHSEFISLPENFTLLAKSESCENESMKHTDRNIYSTQFHPEASGEVGRKLIANFLKTLKIK